MEAILAVTVPFFALVLCGYLAARSRVLPEAAIPGLNAYVLFFALPCLLFRFGSSMPFAQLIDPVLVGIYATCALLMVFFTVAATLKRADQELECPRLFYRNCKWRQEFWPKTPSSNVSYCDCKLALHSPDLQ